MTKRAGRSHLCPGERFRFFEGSAIKLEFLPRYAVAFFSGGIVWIALG
jgi:hypothetical protein